MAPLFVGKKLLGRPSRSKTDWRIWSQSQPPGLRSLRKSIAFVANTTGADPVHPITMRCFNPRIAVAAIAGDVPAPVLTMTRPISVSMGGSSAEGAPLRPRLLLLGGRIASYCICASLRRVDSCCGVKKVQSSQQSSIRPPLKPRRQRPDITHPPSATFTECCRA